MTNWLDLGLGCEKKQAQNFQKVDIAAVIDLFTFFSTIAAHQLRIYVFLHELSLIKVPMIEGLMASQQTMDWRALPTGYKVNSFSSKQMALMTRIMAPQSKICGKL